MAFAKEQKVSASQFTAIGAFRGTIVGLFDFSIKDYKQIPLKEQMEVLVLTGEISKYNTGINVL